MSQPAAAAPSSARAAAFPDDVPARRGPVDRVLLLTVVALLIAGLVIVLSASQLAVPGDPNYWFRHQLLGAAFGAVALIVFARFDYHLWLRYSFSALLVTIASLLAVLIIGHTSYGSQRWLNLGLFSFQPSELAKLVLAVYIAGWLAHKGRDIPHTLRGLGPFALATSLIIFLVFKQNDLGTTVIITTLAIIMFYTAGANLLLLAPTLAVVATLFLLFIAHSGFRRARVDAFLHPVPPGCADASSYQVCQGIISLGSGGLFGRGLGASLQKAGYLPNPFTDSIFAVLGQEAGLIGCVLLLALFALLAFRGFRAGRRAPDTYGALLATGITCWLLIQALVNIGSVVAAIPFTGVPLPFISYGSSSLVASLAAIGILLNISRAPARRPRPISPH